MFGQTGPSISGGRHFVSYKEIPVRIGFHFPTHCNADQRTRHAATRCVLLAYNAAKCDCGQGSAELTALPRFGERKGGKGEEGEEREERGGEGYEGKGSGGEVVQGRQLAKAGPRSFYIQDYVRFETKRTCITTSQKLNRWNWPEQKCQLIIFNWTVICLSSVWC